MAMSSPSSLPTKPFDYRDEWLQTQIYPPPPPLSASQQQHHHHRHPQQSAAIPLPAAVATKTSIHTLRYSYDNVAAISVHSATSNISSPEACDCPSSNSSSASYSQPASPHRSVTRSSEIPVSELERVGATNAKADDNRHQQQRHHRQERQQQQHHQHQHHVVVGDVEKQLGSQMDGVGDTRHRHLGPGWRHRWSVTACHRSSLANDCKIEKKTPSILVFLALINPLLSLAFALYTLLILFFLILGLSLQFCTQTPTFAAQVARYLSPELRLHFSLIHSTADGQLNACNPVRLALLHLASPLLALGTAVCAWVAAVFWVYAAMLGDPDGRGRGDDGRRAVLSVRRYWERILCWALR